MYRRVKEIKYHRRQDNRVVFNRFREHFLTRHYPDDPSAEYLFKKDLKKLSANFSKLFFFQYSLFSKYWFHKHIYSAIVLSGETENINERIRQASVNGSILYLPNHQAHIDSMIISWIANQIGVPQPMFYAWSTLARRRSSYLMPMVNACLLDREIMDNRFKPADPFRDTLKYRAGYSVLINEYLEFMLAKGIDTLIYPEGGRSYSGAIRDARIKRIFKSYANFKIK